MARNKHANVNVSVIIDHNDRQKFAAFYAILINVDRRVSASGKSKNRNRKSSKPKNAQLPCCASPSVEVLTKQKVTKKLQRDLSQRVTIVNKRGSSNKRASLVF